MEIMLYIVCGAVAIIVGYLIFLKQHRKDEEQNISNLILNDNLNLTKDQIKAKIAGKKTEYITATIEDLTIKRTKYDLIFSASNSLLTLTIYIFKNDLCVSFYLQSYEERYSLPFWKYKNEFVDSQVEKRLPDRRMEGELALYTVNKYLEEMDLTYEYFKEEIEWHFEKYFKIREDRYLSISLDLPNLLPRSKRPLYIYLLTTNIKDKEKIRNLLYTKYETWLLPYVIDYDKYQRYLS